MTPPATWLRVERLRAPVIWSDLFDRRAWTLSVTLLVAVAPDATKAIVVPVDQVIVLPVTKLPTRFRAVQPYIAVLPGDRRLCFRSLFFDHLPGLVVPFVCY